MVLCHCNEFNSETISKLHIERTRRILPWTGCFKGSNSSRASVKLAPKFHSRGLHVPSLTLPPFTCAGVSSQRASSERGTGSGTGNRAPKKPQQNENSEVSKSKTAQGDTRSPKLRRWESQGMAWWRPAHALPDEGHPCRNPKPGIGVPSTGCRTGTMWWCSANQPSQILPTGI